jgi:hypothetical protein
MKVLANHLLAAWAGLLTIGLGVVVLTGASPTRSAQFDVIDVKRINVREADGRLRMVIANSEQFPGGILRGEEYHFERPGGGMLFYNDENTEVGGLTMVGHRDAEGQVYQVVHLSMDRYEQDQVIALNHHESAQVYRAGLTINDRGTGSLARALPALTDPEATPEQRREAEALVSEGFAERLFLGRRGKDGDVTLVLADARSKPRLQLRVAADGAAAIEFLDEEGNATNALTPETLAQ